MTSFEAILRDGAGVQRVLGGGYRPRVDQIAYAGDVDQCLRGGRIGLIEGGTGIGKTLGYCVPLVAQVAETGRLGIVSTHSRQLALQVHETLSAAARLVGGRMRIEIRWGMSAFVATGRLKAALEKLENPPDWLTTAVTVGRLSHQADYEALCRRNGLDLDAAPLDWDDICLQPGAQSDREAYDAQLEACRAADIVVTTHAGLLVEVLKSGAGGLFGRDEPALLVVDEAEYLLPAAIEAITRRGSLARLRQRLAGDRVAEGALTALYELAARTPEARVLVPGSREARVVQACFEEIAARLKVLRAKPGLDDEARFEAEMAQMHADAIVTSCDASGAQLALPMLTFSARARAPSIVAQPVNQTGLIYALYRDRESFSRASAVVFTSAVLSADNSDDGFGPILRAFGLGAQKDRLLLAAHEPKAFGKMHIRLLRTENKPMMAWSDTKAVNPLWAEDAIGAVRGLLQDRPGRMLVLTPAWSDLDWFRDLEPGFKGHRLILDQRGVPLTAMLEQVRQDTRAVFVSPRIWAGVDLPGLLAHVAIWRIPNAQPDNDQALLTAFLLEQRGFGSDAIQGVLAAQARNEARQRLRQGIGRAIRREDDDVIVSVLDPRVSDGAWGGMMQSCFPKRFLKPVALKMHARYMQTKLRDAAA